MAEPKPRRNACLIVAVLISPLIVSLLVVIALGAYVITRETPLGELFGNEPDPAQYSEEVVQIREEVAANLEAARKELEQSLKNLPPDCPLPEGRRLDTMLDNAWFKIEEEMLWDLANVASCGLYEEEVNPQEELEDLAERLGTARRAGNATELEKRFDPNERSTDEVLREFRDYVLQADYLDQLETAIDYGVARYIPERPFDYEDDTIRRIGIAAQLPALRAQYALEDDHHENALETSYRLLLLAQPETVPYAPHWNRAYTISSAKLSLMLLMSYGRIPERWRQQFLDKLYQLYEAQDVKTLLLAKAACEPDSFDYMPLINQVRQTNRVFEGVKAGTEILEPPLINCRDKIQALLVEFGVEDFEKDEDQSFISDFFEVMRMNPMEMFVGIQVEMTLQDAVSMYRLRFTGDVARTAFALEAFYEKHGEYPEKLDALVPEFLDAVPVGPVFGELLGYEITDNGYELNLPSQHALSWTDHEKSESEPVSTLAEREKPEVTSVWKVRKTLFSEQAP